jgi:predicted GNAT family acetyltransferase
LTELAELADLASGALRRMEDRDTDLIMEWMTGFIRETGALGPAERVARPILEQRKFYLWDYDGPRCVVAAARETPHGACVNAVFTPEEYRRNGYATAAVAALTKMLLASGKQFCCLYTDVANLTSNAIYHRIGYRPVREDVELIFEDS